MSIQTTIGTVARGYEGQLAEVGAPSYRVSQVHAVPTVNVLAPGKLALRTAVDGVCKAVDDSSSITAATVLGVVMYEASRDPDSFGAKRPVTVIRKGLVYVKLSEAVVAGDAVSYGNKTATLDQWGKTAGANNIALVGFRYAESGGIGAIVAVEVGYIA